MNTQLHQGNLASGSTETLKSREVVLWFTHYFLLVIMNQKRKLFDKVLYWTKSPWCSQVWVWGWRKQNKRKKPELGPWAERTQMVGGYCRRATGLAEAAGSKKGRIQWHHRKFRQPQRNHRVGPACIYPRKCTYMTERRQVGDTKKDRWETDGKSFQSQE